jgi:hypothetical protein
MVEKRGRKTDLDLAIIPGEGRPEPPEGMPEDEARVWRDVVGSMPPNWFSAPALLKLYCRHIARGDTVAQRVNLAGAADDQGEPRRPEEVVRTQLPGDDGRAGRGDEATDDAAVLEAPVHR